MKRFALLGLLAVTMGLLAGCPIYDDHSSPNPDAKGVGGAPSTQTLPAGSCFAQSDCSGINQTCGSDNQCHTGDCTLWGCVNHQACVTGQDQKAHCGDNGVGGAGGTGTTGTTTTVNSGEGGSIGTGGTGTGTGTDTGTGSGTAGGAGAGGGNTGTGTAGAAGGGTAGGAGAGGAAGGAGAAGAGGTGTTTTT